MAIEKTYLLGKNITLGCGFDLQAKAPLDSRQVVPEYDGLQALIEGNAAYEGMIVYDEGTKKTYQAQLVDGVLAFREFGINEAELKALIASETTAAMEFKGVATALPENPSKGDFYKVTASFKVGEDDAKIGDSIVYDGAQWFIIPSGDDIEDTWRPVTDVDNDSTLTFAAGDKLDVAVAADGTITYKHEAIDAPTATPVGEDEQTRTYIASIETDGFGHITGYKTATENVEDTNTTYEFEGLPVGEDEGAPSNVYFQVTSNEEGATAEVIYIDAYTRNEADGKFVEKVDGKQLSTEDFTTALLNKLNGIAEEANKYEHATHTAYAEGFYKVTVDAEGHVSNAVAVTKEDIVALGIPGQDTTYEKVTANADGLMSKEHFTKVEGIAEGATKVENVGGGKIKINDQEVTVYAHPDKHSINDVTGLQDALDGKVGKVDGKGLSTNDLTDELKGQYDAAYAHSQVAHAPADAQANAIESVKVNGTALEITDKAVDITIPESTKVEASETNGNIKVDGKEVTVYEHPESHTASEISDFATEVAKVKVDEAVKADAAAKVDNALTVKVGGTDIVFDGSAAQTADIDTAIAEALANAMSWGEF